MIKYNLIPKNRTSVQKGAQTAKTVKQKKSVKEDQFKNTFFQLLEAQRNIVPRLKADFLFLKNWNKYKTTC